MRRVGLDIRYGKSVGVFLFPPLKVATGMAWLHGQFAHELCVPIVNGGEYSPVVHGPWDQLVDRLQQAARTLPAPELQVGGDLELNGPTEHGYSCDFPVLNENDGALGAVRAAVTRVLPEAEEWEPAVTFGYVDGDNQVSDWQEQMLMQVVPSGTLALLLEGKQYLVRNFAPEPWWNTELSAAAKPWWMRGAGASL